jgi:putative transposase
MRAVIHRPLDGKPKTCTLVNDAGQWFASIVCEVEMADPVPRAGPIVALDRGVVNAVGDSDGRLVPSPRFYENALRRLAHAQRAVSRKKKGSKNREKAKARVAVLHRKVQRQREHFLHVLSSGYAKSHGVVVIERLNTSGMMRSGNRGLSRGIADAGWGKLATFLDYKLTWSGGRLEEEVAAYSSLACSACGCVDARNRVGQSVFRCVTCGHTEHADLNAPKVLLQRFETRASRSGLPVEGTAPEATRRSRKRVALRVPRRGPPAPARAEADYNGKPKCEVSG